MINAGRDTQRDNGVVGGRDSPPQQLFSLDAILFPALSLSLTVPARQHPHVPSYIASCSPASACGADTPNGSSLLARQLCSEAHEVVSQRGEELNAR